MTRWEEAEDRIHIIIDMLKYIPSDISISFLNNHDTLTLSHQNISPDDFASDAHRDVNAIFDKLTKKLKPHTPTYPVLEKAFRYAAEPTQFYLFTDGEPNQGGGPDEVTKLIKMRSNPQNKPLTFVLCTNEDQAWIENVDEQAQKE